MKRLLVMLGISLLVAGGFLPLYSEARIPTNGRVQGLDQELIRDVQRQLKGLGFNPGAVDGNYGEQTAAALRAYQQAYRLPVTGRLDEATVRSLLPEQFEASRAPFEASRAPIDLSNREVIRPAQRQLKALGFNPGAIDGNFGSQTAAALRAYQHAYRLQDTGKLDEVTLRSLLPERFEASRAPFEVSLAIDPSNREVIRPAQRQLKALGFNPGAVDGNYGEQTAAALRAYQQAYRLPVTGRLDEATVRSLLPEQVSTSPAPIDSSDRKLISRVQIQLRTLGFDPGAVDGDIGQQTEAALQAYQHANRLPETGRLDEVTLLSLLPQMRQGALR